MPQRSWVSHSCSEVTHICLFCFFVICRAIYMCPFFATGTFYPLFSRFWAKTQLATKHACLVFFILCVHLEWTSFNCFFDFAPHFPNSCLFKGRCRLFESKVGLLSSLNSLKYGLDVRIAVLPRFCPLLFNAVSFRDRHYVAWNDVQQIWYLLEFNWHSFCSITCRYLFILITWASFFSWRRKLMRNAAWIKNVFQTAMWVSY